MPKMSEVKRTTASSFVRSPLFFSDMRQVVSQSFKFLFLLLGFIACGPPVLSLLFAVLPTAMKLPRLMIWKATERQLEEAGVLALIAVAAPLGSEDANAALLSGAPCPSCVASGKSRSGSDGAQHGQVRCKRPGLRAFKSYS